MSATQARSWIDRGATEWRCADCRKVLGYVLGAEFFTYHHGRTITARVEEISQVCNGCGATNLHRPIVCGPTGIIPGRAGQAINSGGDTAIPPLRPDPPRPEDRAYVRPVTTAGRPI